MVAAAVIGSAVVGAAVSSSSASSASYAQRKAAADANATQQGQLDQTRADQKPYRDLATEVGLPGIRNFLSSNNNQLTPDQVMADPGYQFGLTQGNRNIQGSAAARGGLYSGATLKALNKFGGDYATGRYNDTYNRMETSRINQFNRFASAAQIGQVANNQVAAAGQNFANNVSGNMIGAGNAQAASSLAQGNAWGNALNQGISSYGRMSSPSAAGSAGNAGYGDYSDPSWFNQVQTY